LDGSAELDFLGDLCYGTHSTEHGNKNVAAAPAFNLVAMSDRCSNSVCIVAKAQEVEAAITAIVVRSRLCQHARSAKVGSDAQPKLVIAAEEVVPPRIGWGGHCVSEVLLCKESVEYTTYWK